MWKNSMRIAHYEWAHTNIEIMKNFILDILFPKFCINCQREGSYLCQDCFSLIDISENQYDPFLYYATPYNNFLVKKTINQFKYQPYIKELAKPLSSLIIAHLINIDKTSYFQDYILLPIPLHKKKLKKRGFNQATEIAQELSRTLKIPLFDDVLIKIKQTPAQVELKKEEREKNIRGAFFCQKPEIIQARKVLLVDDIYTTGATMEEARRVVKAAGAQKIQGLVVARGRKV